MIRSFLVVGLGAVGSYVIYRIVDRIYFSDQKEEESEDTEIERKTSSQPVYNNMDPLELGDLTTCSSLSASQVGFLFALLRSENPGVVERTLRTIGNLAAFTSNQNVMRESGLLQAVVETLQRSDESPGVQDCCCQALANLAMNVANQPVVQSCLPIVVNKIVQSTENDPVTLSILKLLTNMTVLDDYHHHLYPAVPKLLQLSTTEDATVQLQSLKVLVNLSCNQASIEALLHSPAPPTFLALLQSTAADVQLRAVTFVANVISSQEEEVVSSDFTADSLQAVLYGSGGRRRDMYAMVLKLTKHPSEDVRRQASRVLVAKMLRYDNQD
ncbi:armadillo repeat-containing protein 10-like [Branchiostoma lanceolatum]|uniref:armadillo repeat-containing protein 10-like n=1 Tax=Branchiostoma lanceolatum TaxID=7740 RepID=UPI0034540714